MVKNHNQRIGRGEPCFIIAEAGVNHNGDISTAKKLVMAAKGAGANAVKFQTYQTETLVAKQDVEQTEMLKSLELTKDNFKELKSFCDMNNIYFLSTPFDNESADFLNELDIPIFKISSGDLDNHKFLEHVARFKKPMLVSTGMSTKAEIEKALQVIEREGNREVIFLQCTSAYPAPAHEVNLNVIPYLEESLEVSIGFSDHTVGIEIPIAAVALGACVVEKHLTLDKKSNGSPDHAMSTEPGEFRKMVESIRNVEMALGSSMKDITQSEIQNKQKFRKRIFASKELKAGDLLAGDSMVLRRYTEGLEASVVKGIQGRKLLRNIPKNYPIHEGDLE